MNEYVAPHAGAWIEIKLHVSPYQTTMVAPHAGAWIEIGRHTPEPN